MYGTQGFTAGVFTPPSGELGYSETVRIFRSPLRVAGLCLCGFKSTYLRYIQALLKTLKPENPLRSAREGTFPCHISQNATSSTSSDATGSIDRRPHPCSTKLPATSSTHDEHYNDPDCSSTTVGAKLQGDLSWMPLPMVLALAPKIVLVCFWVSGGNSSSRNGLALDEASTRVELVAAPAAFCASSSALRFFATWLCFSFRSMFLSTNGRFLS